MFAAKHSTASLCQSAYRRNNASEQIRPRGDRDALLRRADEVIESPQEGRDCRVAALALPGHHSALHQFCRVSQAEETTQGWVDHVQSMPEFVEVSLTPG